MVGLEDRVLGGRGDGVVGFFFEATWWPAKSKVFWDGVVEVVHCRGDATAGELAALHINQQQFVRRTT